uniref:NADH-ubiquinone oxidoreductase chain 6 n=1 Tax=Oenopia sauzeti TaxID=420097 RepID=A0A8E5JTN5_9CUCU|nr:NADH dehydrogenase subunit 6 [Oenopia sauzeti]QVD39759.1 NADH dehydrogenase subunit 6 [Oenopia sauzeti]
MFLMLMTSTLMMFMKHPLSMGLVILMHTIITCIYIGLMSLNFWFSYILILIMIGGLLVLFIYMTSIASNEKFKFNKILFTMISIFTISMIFNLTLNNKYNLNFMLNNELLNNMNFNLNLSKFITFPNSNIFMIIVFYLLIAMIAVVKITKVSFGPLRQFK